RDRRGCGRRRGAGGSGGCLVSRRQVPRLAREEVGKREPPVDARAVDGAVLAGLEDLARERDGDLRPGGLLVVDGLVDRRDLDREDAVRSLRAAADLDVLEEVGLAEGAGVVEM